MTHSGSEDFDDPKDLEDYQEPFARLSARRARQIKPLTHEEVNDLHKSPNDVLLLQLSLKRLRREFIRCIRAGAIEVEWRPDWYLGPGKIQPWRKREFFSFDPALVKQVINMICNQLIEDAGYSGVALFKEDFDRTKLEEWEEQLWEVDVSENIFEDSGSEDDTIKEQEKEMSDGEWEEDEAMMTQGEEVTDTEHEGEESDRGHEVYGSRARDTGPSTGVGDLVGAYEEKEYTDVEDIERGDAEMEDDKDEEMEDEGVAEEEVYVRKAEAQTKMVYMESVMIVRLALSQQD